MLGYACKMTFATFMQINSQTAKEQMEKHQHSGYSTGILIYITDNIGKCFNWPSL